MKLRTFTVITVSKDINNKFNTMKVKDLTEQEAKEYIRIAIKNDGFGVMMSRTFPSSYKAYNKLTKKLINDYITAMQSKNFKNIMKIYNKFDKIGMKVSINY